jgi:uncharacterized Zn finger protein
MAWYHEWRPYVSAAERDRRATRTMARRAKNGLPVEPIVIEGRTIARTFWGKAWCDHLERYCDYENRLPRGRTYVRRGAVLHLGIGARRVEALVQGSRPSPYEVEVSISGLAKARWQKIVASCAGQIDSLVELLQGKLSSGVMKVVTDPQQGLFPSTAEIEIKCSCPDWATMCKHIAAVLYGVGARLDAKPELLFVLRGVDHLELLDAKAVASGAPTGDGGTRRRIADDHLGSVFGIEMDASTRARTRGGRGRPWVDVAPRHETNGRASAAPMKAAAAAQPSEASDAGRRSLSKITEIVDAIVALLRRHPEGLRAEQIRAQLGLPAKALPRPIAEGLLTARLRKRGRKRATTYFAGR